MMELRAWLLPATIGFYIALFGYGFVTGDSGILAAVVVGAIVLIALGAFSYAIGPFGGQMRGR